MSSPYPGIDHPLTKTCLHITGVAPLRNLERHILELDYHDQDSQDSQGKEGDDTTITSGDLADKIVENLLSDSDLHVREIFSSIRPVEYDLLKDANDETIKRKERWEKKNEKEAAEDFEMEAKEAGYYEARECAATILPRYRIFGTAKGRKRSSRADLSHELIGKTYTLVSSETTIILSTDIKNLGVTLEVVTEGILDSPEIMKALKDFVGDSGEWLWRLDCVERTLPGFDI